MTAPVVFLSRRFLGLAVFLALGSAPVAATPIFIGLHTLFSSERTETASSQAYGVSRDGSTVVGSAARTDGGSEAFRWEVETGLRFLGGYQSLALAAADRGGPVVGERSTGRHIEGMRWPGGAAVAPSDGQPLGGPYRVTSAYDVSDDGAWVAGRVAERYSSGPGSPSRAAVWSAADGWSELSLPSGTPAGAASQASALTADGKTVVGSVTLGFENERAFRWTAAGGARALGDLSARASDISSEGSVVVGRLFEETGPQAFRWTESDGFSRLGDLPGGASYSVATDTAAGGAAILGESAGEAGREVFYWTPGGGLRSLKSLLIEEYGLGSLLEGWTLESAGGISDDGLVIVGTGRNARNQTEAWMARLDTFPSSASSGVPEPSAYALAGALLLVGAVGRRLLRWR